MAKPLAEAIRHAEAMAKLENFMLEVVVVGQPLEEFVVTATTKADRRSIDGSLVVLAVCFLFLTGCQQRI